MEQESLFDMKEAGCRFCSVIKGEAESYAVFEDEHSLAFLDLKPLLPGHVLLVPKQHIETFNDLPEKMVGILFSDVQLIARAVEEGLSADGSFVAVNTKISQSVPHLHVHIVPRWKGDGLFSRNFVWMRRPYRDLAHMRSTAEAVKAAVARLMKE